MSKTLSKTFMPGYGSGITIFCKLLNPLLSQTMRPWINEGAHAEVFFQGIT